MHGWPDFLTRSALFGSCNKIASFVSTKPLLRCFPKNMLPWNTLYICYLADLHLSKGHKISYRNFKLKLFRIRKLIFSCFVFILQWLCCDSVMTFFSTSINKSSTTRLIFSRYDIQIKSDKLILYTWLK